MYTNALLPRHDLSAVHAALLAAPRCTEDASGGVTAASITSEPPSERCWRQPEVKNRAGEKCFQCRSTNTAWKVRGTARNTDAEEVGERLHHAEKSRVTLNKKKWGDKKRGVKREKSKGELAQTEENVEQIYINI